MADQPNKPVQRPAVRRPGQAPAPQARAPMPKPRMPGQGEGMPGLGGRVKPPAQPAQAPTQGMPGLGGRVKPPVQPAPPTKQRPRQAPNSAVPSKRSSAPVQTPRKPSGPVDVVSSPRKTSQPQAAPEPPKPKKEPTTIEELIPVLVRHAVKKDDGLTIAQFDEKFMPRVQAMVPESLQRMSGEIVQEYLVDIGHALYVAIVVGQFSSRPVLCGVRAAELAADLVERVLAGIAGKEDKRITGIRCSNLLVGLTLNSVRLIESTSLGSQTLRGFTDNFERAVITTYGLKTQAEATGAAPWVGQKNNPLDKRIGRAINTMSNVFGDYIGEHGPNMDDRQYDEVVGEFDGFMDRFAPYIEGGSKGAEERRKKLARGTSIKPGASKVEPLTIEEVRTRPAGVELALTDGRVVFISTEDARRIGQAADGEVDDTAKRERQQLEARMKDSNPGQDAEMLEL